MKTPPPSEAPRAPNAGDLHQQLLTMLRNARLRLRLQAGLTIALAVGFVLSVAVVVGLLSAFDAPVTDFVYQPQNPSGQVVVIAIDQKSLDEIGPPPWSRSVHAQLLAQLGNAPRVIAFDMTLAETTREDAEFAAAIKQAGNVILATTAVQASARPLRPNTLPTFGALALPAPELRAAARGIGHRMLHADPDGILRRVPLALEADGARYPALGLGAAQNLIGVQEIQYDLPAHTVGVGSIQMRVDEFGRGLLNFTRTHDGIPVYSYANVLKGRVPTQNLAGKIVLIGDTNTTETAVYISPLSSGNSAAYNVLIEANLADMLVSTPAHVLSQAGTLEQVLAVMFIALAAGLTLPHLRPLSATVLTLLFLLVVMLLGFEAFNRGVIVNVLYPSLALLITFGLITTFRYLSEERRRQFLTTLFRRYLPAESVGRVVDAVDRGELPLSGTRRNVTVLYADLRGFAEISEGLAPEAMLQLVNQYLELMMRAIMKEHGTVNKPMGDALVAIWNAPLDQPDHARRALRAAINIRRSILRFQKRPLRDFQRAEEQTLNFGLGLATGWAVLGNISALGKTEYTLVGETVNIAARISAFAGNNQILADAATAHAAPKGAPLRELSPVRVRGRKEPLPVWEVRDPKEGHGEEEEGGEEEEIETE